MRTTAFVLLALMFLTGCGPYKEEFKVWVKNDTKEPITIGFTKDSGPDQDIFITPKFLAQDTKMDPEKTAWGMLVAPGKTAAPNPSAPVVALLDDKNGQVFLHVYKGEINLTEILSISSGSPRRIDITLTPGESHYTIVEVNGRLQAKPGK